MNPQRDRLVLARRRRKAAILFKRGLSPTEVARRLGVRRQSAHAWFKSWQTDGAEGLKSRGATGRKPRLSKDDLERICALVSSGAYACGYETDLWTLSRVVDLIKNTTGLKYHPGHVWHLLRSMGLSCQRPDGHPPDSPASRGAKSNVWKTREWKARTWRISGKCRITRRRA